MDIAAIATVAVRVLVPFFKGLAKKVGDAAIDHLADAVKAKLPAETYEGAVLKGVEEEPENPTRQAALKDALEQVMTKDPSFAETLHRLVEEVPEGRTMLIQATESGAIAGGNFTQTGTNVAGRDLNIQPPAGGS